MSLLDRAAAKSCGDDCDRLIDLAVELAVHVAAYPICRDCHVVSCAIGLAADPQPRQCDRGGSEGRGVST